MICDPTTYTTIAAGTIDEAGIAAAANLRLMGYSVKETAGSVATLNLRHGTGGSDPIIAAENLAAAGSESRSFYPQGLPVDGGIFIDRLTGETAITLVTKIA